MRRTISLLYRMHPIFAMHSLPFRHRPKPAQRNRSKFIFCRSHRHLHSSRSSHNIHYRGRLRLNQLPPHRHHCNNRRFTSHHSHNHRCNSHSSSSNNCSRWRYATRRRHLSNPASRLKHHHRIAAVNPRRYRRQYRFQSLRHRLYSIHSHSHSHQFRRRFRLRHRHICRTKRNSRH